MGTNYYAVRPAASPCPHCGRGDAPERLHIGKSSAGWCFSVHVIPEKGIESWADWVTVLSSGSFSIVNEYGETVRLDVLRRVVEERSHPHGLSRHYGHGVVGHGEGTWDLIEGDFS